MYHDIMTYVRTQVGMLAEFLNTISLHQGSALSLYLFALVIDEITNFL